MAARSVFSVSQINTYIKNMFRQDYMLPAVFVRGEVSNCKYHSSGHIYFTLKDAGGTLNAVMFLRDRASGLKFEMHEGDEVVAAGSIDVYEKTGSYQLYAKQIVRDGAGLLNEKYEQLKKKLEEEGMFDERYKQPVPKYIHTLGIVTAPTGAAVQDIINISRRRDPWLRIILYPAIVQGAEAPASIVSGIRALASLPPADRPDTLIIGRGGGSIEDLWAFNEEIVAQAVFDCPIPVISAVGHETDTVITDYVADLRAPTPSAAAELAVFEYSRFTADLSAYAQGMTDSIGARIAAARQQAESCRRELAHLSPAVQVRERRMFLSQSADTLKMRMDASLLRAKHVSESMSAAQLSAAMAAKIEKRRHTLQLCASGLEGLSPLRRLSGGYGYVSDDKGKAVTSVLTVKAGDRLQIRMRDGRITAEAKTWETWKTETSQT
ncbi:MAG: exodeoxyribonuclease VII large subunit [Lachnospiraceae bacterium]|jgi:exodeoxyribonuclease VII large subunit|nr:exodeoxyribonuclease VII large subunit [Lachnospiraceae bacterium]